MPTSVHHMQKVLVVGGAGFIGSHMVLALREAKFDVVVLDNLSKGHRHAVLDAELIVGDMADKNLLSALFSKYQFAAVMHFGSLIEVGESIQDPQKYYQNNVAATLNLLDIMLENNVNNIIFSSSAAVYGEPKYTPIDEVHPLLPVSPYGRTKLMVEEIIQDYARAYDLNFAILRYFNAAGCDPQRRLREHHQPESHLIPIILQVAAGLREHILIYGNDYPTPDGTCVRDYIHVSDLCSAHLSALQALLKEKHNLICNLGTGRGYSVQEVIEAAHAITGLKIPTKIHARRAGDPAILVANASLACARLGWKPKYTQLDQILTHAWASMDCCLV